MTIVKDFYKFELQRKSLPRSSSGNRYCGHTRGRSLAGRKRMVLLAPQEESADAQAQAQAQQIATSSSYSTGPMDPDR